LFNFLSKLAIFSFLSLLDAHNIESTKSIIDIAIKTRSPLKTQHKKALIESLASLLGRPVDLVDLRSTGEPLLGQILHYGKQVKGSDSSLASLALQHLYANEDFMPYVHRALKERRSRWSK